MTNKTPENNPSITQSHLVALSPLMPLSSHLLPAQVGLTPKEMTSTELVKIFSAHVKEYSIPSQWLDQQELISKIPNQYLKEKRVWLQISSGYEIENNKETCEKYLKLGFNLEILTEKNLIFREKQILREWHLKFREQIRILYIANRKFSFFEELADLIQSDQLPLSIVFFNPPSKYSCYFNQKEINLLQNWLKDKNQFAKKITFHVFLNNENDVKDTATGSLNTDISNRGLELKKSQSVNLTLLPQNERLPLLINLFRKISIFRGLFFFLEDVTEYLLNPSKNNFEKILSLAIMRTANYFLQSSLRFYHTAKRASTLIYILFIKTAYLLKHYAMHFFLYGLYPLRKIYWFLEYQLNKFKREN